MLPPATRVWRMRRRVNFNGLWSEVSKRNHKLKSVPHQGPTLPKKPSIEKTIKDLREEIQRHEDLYYLKDNPEISDREYDELIDKLRQLEEQNPKFISPASHTHRVAAK